MKRRGLLLRGLLLLLPLLFAAVGWLFLTNGMVTLPFNESGDADPRIRFTLGAALSSWVLLLGLLGTILATGGTLLWCWSSRRARQQTIAAQQQQLVHERRNFVQRLDHELKNPLTAMHAGIANLRSTATGAADHATLDSLEGQTMRLSRLTADLRKLSGLETRALDQIEIDLGQLLQEAIDLIEEKPEMATRRFTVNIPQAPWPLPTIQGDWDLLFLAVYNLLDNAVKFTEAGNAIEVRAREEGPVVLIEVADTGPGIDPAEQTYIWHELYRGQTTRHISGSGLGLPLVRAIIERHNGSVTLDSRLGQGTVMAVRLPFS